MTMSARGSELPDPVRAYREAFGQIVRERREELELTKTVFAKRVPTTPLTVERIENGFFSPPIDLFWPLADALSIDVAVLSARTKLLAAFIQRARSA
jgi:transcriptional regulator with XRE-family HTH domain